MYIPLVLCSLCDAKVVEFFQVIKFCPSWYGGDDETYVNLCINLLAKSAEGREGSFSSTSSSSSSFFFCTFRVISRDILYLLLDLFSRVTYDSTQGTICDNALGRSRYLSEISILPEYDSDY